MKKALATAAAGVALVALAGCAGQSYEDKRGWGDAGISTHDDGKWQVVNAPDGFGNIATRCNPFQAGTRVYVVTHSLTDTQPIIKDDTSCGGEGK